MAVNIVKGSDKDIIVRLTSQSTGDPFDLTGVTLIRACFVKADGESLHEFYLALTGDIATGSDLISNIDTTNIQEGDPVLGTGIQAGAYVLKTPTSETSPTAAGTIQISSNATATTVGLAITVGTISILNAIIGKIQIGLPAEDTELLEAGDAEDFELKIVKSGETSYVQFPDSLAVVERLC